MVEGVGAEGGLREEVERLRRDLAEAREQQAATSGVLAVLGRATSDLDAVLETVVDSARHLCGADIALIFLLEGDAYRLAIASGPLTEEDRAYLAQHPLAQDRGRGHDHGHGRGHVLVPPGKRGIILYTVRDATARDPLASDLPSGFREGDGDDG